MGDSPPSQEPAPERPPDGLRFRRFLYRTYSRFSGSSGRWRNRLTPAGRLLGILMVFAGALGLNTHVTSAYQLFTLLLVLFSGAVIHGWFFRPDLTVRRRLPRFATALTPLPYEVTVHNRSARPATALRLREQLPQHIPTRDQFLYQEEPDERKRNRFDRTFLAYRWMWLVRRARRADSPESEAFAVPASGETTVRMRILPHRRGVFHLHDMAVSRPDLFGLLKSRRRLPAQGSDTLTVLPRRYALPALALAGRSRYQPSGITHATAIGQAEEFVGLREYQRGDSIRHLDWKSWARTGVPIVREYEDEFMPRYALALDTFAAFDHDPVFEEAVSVAASFACTLDTKESLLDLMFVGDEAHCFTSGRGSSQPEHLLEILAGVELCPDKRFSELDQLVRSHAHELSACVYILLAWDTAREACMRRIRASGVDLLVLVICPPDSTLPEDVVEPGVHFIRSNEVAAGVAAL